MLHASCIELRSATVCAECSQPFCSLLHSKTLLELHKRKTFNLKLQQQLMFDSLQRNYSFREPKIKKLSAFRELCEALSHVIVQE